MPGLNGAAYQIGNWTNFKPELPGILKEYAKAAIRTDPRDLLQWSRDYFRALSRGSAPLDKDRWEEVTSLDNHSGITVGLLRLLHKQLSGGRGGQPSDDVNLGDIIQLWTTLGLERQRLDDLLELVSIATPPLNDGQDLETQENAETRDNNDGQPNGAKPPRNYDPATVVDWNKLLALAAGQLGDSLGETMETLCTILTTDDDGGSSLPVDTFIEMYTYLANIDGDIGQEEIEAVVEYAGRVAQLQDGTVNRFNLKSALCPTLH
ncbi:ropporin-1-like protein [Daphnia carinata]|uniref:ropporin-1-like protein n=1 Tax=Daphnia carinata TaxID=120202 RepID=UPI00257CF07B|nr:ropporin-1-like protein [Daphnia carinata]